MLDSFLATFVFLNILYFLESLWFKVVLGVWLPFGLYDFKLLILNYLSCFRWITRLSIYSDFLHLAIVFYVPSLIKSYCIGVASKRFH